MRTSDEARAILDQARQTLAECADIEVRDNTHSRRDPLQEWRRNMPKPEPETRSAMTDAMIQRTIDNRIAALDSRIDSKIADVLAKYDDALKEDIAATFASRKQDKAMREKIAALELRVDALLAEIEKLQRGVSSDRDVIDLAARRAS